MALEDIAAALEGAALTPEAKANLRAQLGVDAPEASTLGRIASDMWTPIARGAEAGGRELLGGLAELNPFGRGTESPVQVGGRLVSGLMRLANVIPVAGGAALSSPVKDLGPAAQYRPRLPGGRSFPSAAEVVDIIGQSAAGAAPMPAAAARAPAAKAAKEPSAAGLLTRSILAEERGAAGRGRTASGKFQLSRVEEISPEAKQQARAQREEIERDVRLPRGERPPSKAEQRLVDIGLGAPTPPPSSPVYNVDPSMSTPLPTGQYPDPLPRVAGEPDPRRILGPTYEGQQKQALLLREPTAEALAKKPELYPLVADIAENAPPSEALRRSYELGKQIERWYVRSLPEVIQLVRNFVQAAPSRIARRIDVENDPLLVARNIAATSPRTAPYDNVGRAIDRFIEWLEAGRPKDYEFGGLEAHARNLDRAVRGEVLEGQKISNYLLNELGSEWNVTIDRWMVRLLLGRHDTAGAGLDVTKLEYEVAAQRLRQLATHFGTTPARAQAALWTGAKILADPRIYKLLDPRVLNPGATQTARRGILTLDQAVPALPNIIRYRGEQLARAVGNDPGLLKAITPPVILAGMLLEMAGGDAAPPPGL